MRIKRNPHERTKEHTENIGLVTTAAHYPRRFRKVGNYVAQRERCAVQVCAGYQ
jgi:hypothetical protein